MLSCVYTLDKPRQPNHSYTFYTYRYYSIGCLWTVLGCPPVSQPRTHWRPNRLVRGPIIFHKNTMMCGVTRMRGIIYGQTGYVAKDNPLQLESNAIYQYRPLHDSGKQRYASTFLVWTIRQRHAWERS